MKYKYQLLMLGSDTGIRQTVASRILLKIKELGLDEEILKIVDSHSFDDEYLGNQPAFGIYFGDKVISPRELEITDKLIKDGTMILPIFFNSFSAEIPKELSNQNGLHFCEHEIDRIANVVLEAFELLRSSRKIFISYRRDESTSVAIQLYEALESYNYDVFLDTHAIGKGQPFQDELWHRMTDCDVIVLLNTKDFLESHWCKEEFAEAAAKQIGIVQLIWPDHHVLSMDATSYLSYPIQTKPQDFIDEEFKNKDQSKLNKIFIEQILQEVESVRARNLAARQDNLITEFRNIAEKHGRNVTVQPEKFLTEDRPDGKRIVYIPTIGIPQSKSCQTAELKKEIYGKDDISIRLIYDDIRIRNEWLKHLDWLNENLIKDIKTLKKQEFESWLTQV